MNLCTANFKLETWKIQNKNLYIYIDNIFLFEMSFKLLYKHKPMHLKVIENAWYFWNVFKYTCINLLLINDRAHQTTL